MVRGTPRKPLASKPKGVQSGPGRLADKLTMVDPLTGANIMPPVKSRTWAIKRTATTSISSAAHFAAAMRQDPTKHEARVKRIIARLGLAREMSDQVVIRGYIADFLHTGMRQHGLPDVQPFIVEIDGASHFTAAGLVRDLTRDSALRGEGFAVYHIKNSEVEFTPKAVAMKIWSYARPDVPYPTEIKLGR